MLALSEGEWSASYPGCLTSSETVLVPIGQNTVLASEPVWMQWQREKIPAPVRS